MSNDLKNITKDDLVKTLEEVQAPQTDIPVAKFMTSVEDSDGRLVVQMSAPNERSAQLAIEAAVKTAISQKGFNPAAVSFRFAQTVTESIGDMPEPKQMDKIKHIIAIGSGKGGVGKSTVTINLAAAMAMKGLKVGVLDADIYGPSIGKMTGYVGKTDVEAGPNGKLLPISKYGIKLMSFSFLIDQNQSVAWRGPMLGKALEQFLFDIAWDELDYLFIDLPPGTGDVQLSLSQLVELDGAVIVTTPQSVALLDAERAVDMFARVNLPVLGVIENMAEFICPHCGEGSDIFSSGGGVEMAKEMEINFLGSLPLSRKIMESGEKGFPIMTVDKKGDDVSDEMKKLIGSYEEVIVNLEKSIS